MTETAIIKPIVRTPAESIVRAWLRLLSRTRETSVDPGPNLSMGIAKAWESVRVARRAPEEPAQRWALEEDDGERGWTIFWDVDAALKDRLDEGHTTATLRRCVIAFPPNLEMDERMEQLNEAEDVADWSDFAAQEEDVVQVLGTGAQKYAIRCDLEAMVAATFRAWAEKHGCQLPVGSAVRNVEINAWRFIGPERRFVRMGEAWHEVTPT